MRKLVVILAVILSITYGLSLLEPQNVFDLAVRSFTGFGSLFPLVFAALYWKRTTKAGAYPCVITMLATWFLFFGISVYWGELVIGDGISPSIAFAASAAALVGVSLVTTPPSRKALEMFFPDFTGKQPGSLAEAPALVPH